MNKSDSFYNLETLGEILLFIAAVLAIIVANSPYRMGHDRFLSINGREINRGISGFIIGNTAENILQKIDCSLLALKPPVFVSPVKAY